MSILLLAKHREGLRNSSSRYTMTVSDTPEMVALSHCSYPHHAKNSPLISDLLVTLSNDLRSRQPIQQARVRDRWGLQGGSKTTRADGLVDAVLWQPGLCICLSPLTFNCHEFATQSPTHLGWEFAVK
jgi:hypothetical protein